MQPRFQCPNVLPRLAGSVRDQRTGNTREENPASRRRASTEANTNALDMKSIIKDKTDDHFSFVKVIDEEPNQSADGSDINSVKANRQSISIIV